MGTEREWEHEFKGSEADRAEVHKEN